VFGGALAWVLLNEGLFAADLGWRLAFGLGAVLGLGILLVRRNVPESPRWMFIHGHNEQAEELVDGIEREVEKETGERLEPVERSITIRQRRALGFGTIAHTAFKRYPRRTVLGLALFIYVASGVLLIGTGLLFNARVLSAATLTACWMVVFFFASAGASAADLTGSEIFPMETRAMALAFFYAVGTGIGGVVGPALFGKLVETGKEVNVFYGYLIASAVMIAAGVAEWLLGVDAERKSLEDIAAPLTAEEARAEATT
jgi:MFS family permease